MERIAMDRNKTDWDYFTELMTAVPGLTAMFSDAVGSNGDSRDKMNQSGVDDSRHAWATRNG